MSTNISFVIVGVALFLYGLAKGVRFNLRNFSINVGGTSTQTIKTGDIASAPNKSSKPDWVGLAVAAIGLLTALVHPSGIEGLIFGSWGYAIRREASLRRSSGRAWPWWR
jgi:predicted anti-sigma-YlaC factor YlaD